MTNLSSESYVVLKTITPEYAAQLLATQAANRTLSKYQVDRFARDLINGNWVVNGETVKINERNEVIDGQHRLAAIVLSGVSMTTFVAYNLPADEPVQATTDQGRRRSLADALKIEQNLTHNTQVAAALSVLWRWLTDNMSAVSLRPTYAESLRLLEEHPDIVESVAYITGMRGKTVPRCNPSVAAWSHLVFTNIDPIDGRDFWKIYQSPYEFNNIGQNHPVLKLRNYMQAVQNANDKAVLQPKTAALIIKSWNAFRLGVDIGTLRWSGAERMPAIDGVEAVKDWFDGWASPPDGV